LAVVVTTPSRSKRKASKFSRVILGTEGMHSTLSRQLLRKYSGIVWRKRTPSEYGHGRLAYYMSMAMISQVLEDIANQALDASLNVLPFTNRA
jgi:hypothetical protein